MVNCRRQFLPTRHAFPEKQFHRRVILAVERQIDDPQVDIAGGGNRGINLGEQFLTGFSLDDRFQLLHGFFIGFPQRIDPRLILLLFGYILMTDQIPHVQIDAVNRGTDTPRFQGLDRFDDHCIGRLVERVRHAPGDCGQQDQQNAHRSET